MNQNESGIDGSETINVEESTDVTAPLVAVQSNVPKVIKGRPGPKVRADSGLQKAVAIFSQMAGAKRKELVKAFVQAGVKPGTANAYYHLIVNGKKS